jgi:selenocysteine-specific elongation factor
VVARAGDRFVLRSYSPVTTIAGGRVVEPVAPKRKRAPPELRQDLAAVLEPDSAVAAAASLAGFAGIPLGSLPLLVPRETTRKRPDTMDGFMAGGRLFHAPLVTQAADVIRAAVARFHERQPLAPGIPRETLRQVLPAHAHPALVDAVIERLVETEAIAADGPVLRDPTFVATLDPAQQQAAARIETLFLEAGLASPARDEIPDPLATRADLDDLLHYLQRSDRLIALPGHRWVHPTALEKAIQRSASDSPAARIWGPPTFGNCSVSPVST